MTLNLCLLSRKINKTQLVIDIWKIKIKNKNWNLLGLAVYGRVVSVHTIIDILSTVYLDAQWFLVRTQDTQERGLGDAMTLLPFKTACPKVSNNLVLGEHLGHKGERQLKASGLVHVYVSDR